jgi:spermidine synthase
MLGVRGTFLLAAVFLMGGATLLLWCAKDSRLLLLLWLPLLGLGQLDAHGPAISSGERLLGAAESSYQSIRVIESGGADNPSRRLVVNEALDSFQSVWSPRPGLLGGGHYYDLFALPLAWQEVPPTWNLLVLGLGAGTAVRVIGGVLPEDTELVWTGVEIDPAVVRLGQEHMDLAAEPPSRVLTGWDSRAALAVLSGPFEQIILDSYANNMEIPFHLATVEFFSEALDKLAPGGWLTLNAAGFGVQDSLIVSLAGTLAAAADRRALILEVPFSRNAMVFVRRDGEIPFGIEAAKFEAPAPIQTLLQSLGAPGTFRWVEPASADDLLTDDRAPLEQLQRASIARGRRDWGKQGLPQESQP